MKIFTSYFGNVVRISKAYKMYNTSTQIHFVNIALYPPKSYVNHHAFSELEPSDNILSGLKRKKITQSQYDYIYSKRLDELNAKDIYDKCLKLYGEDSIVVFLCYEKPSDHCHRNLFRQWMENNGYDVKEFPAHPVTISKILNKNLKSHEQGILEQTSI